MSQDRPTPAPKERLALQWPTLLSFLTAFVATGTIALHLIGVVRHRQHLRFWGIDADLFPKATDWILINGYYGIVDRFSVILKTIIENWHWLGIASILIGVYIFILQTPASNTPGKLKEWVSSCVATASCSIHFPYSYDCRNDTSNAHFIDCFYGYTCRSWRERWYSIR